MPKRLSRLALVAVAVLFLIAIPTLVDFYADWLWFGETGYRRVFLRVLSAKSLLFTAAFAIVLPFLWWNLRHALATLARREIVIMTPQGPQVLSMDAARLRPFVAGLTVLATLLVATRVASHWDTALLFWNGAPVGRADPILGHEVAFYLFSWPWLQIVQQTLFMTLLLALVGVAAAHVLSGSLSMDAARGLVVSPAARRHLTWLVAGVLLTLVFGSWLDLRGLLLSPGGLIQGASYVDVHARMLAYRVLMAAGVVAAALAVASALRPRKWLVAGGIALYAVVWLGGAVVATLLQRLIVTPNEQVRETPYIAHNIQATLEAFALDDVAERAVSGDATLTRADIDANQGTLANVRLWDHEPLLDTFSQIQEIRTYYDFVSVDNDRYTIDGEYRQIMLSARELNSENLPNRSWINERLTFTHGYGLALGPVNETTDEGLPMLFIRNLPPDSTVDLRVDQPAIYFGELSNDHVFVTTATREFDYPQGEDNVYGSYAGRGGVSVGSLFRRLLFAIRFRSAKTLLSDDITGDSRVLYYRRIGERAQKIAPFLTYDQDPYLAIDEGRLYWIQDAYTTSRHYPYARGVEAFAGIAAGTNYIRNSIKVVIDAYHGTTTFYLVDPRDPVALTLQRAFPGLLRPLAEMPEGLRNRLRYPSDIFTLQTAIYTTYHMRNPAVFYNKEDQWEVPAIDVGGQPERMQPYYTIMKLPGEQDAEFIQMLPFTPRQKNNLAAWMVARSDGANYGQLAVFQFPKQKLIFGPRQVVARISQDQTIAPQITLWNQQGAEVILGTLLVIPIEESLIYVRPLYLRAAGGQIVELRRVIVAYQNRIMMEPTLDEALERMFPKEGARQAEREAPEKATPTTTAEGAPPVDEAARALLARANDHYQRAVAAQRAGDWARYGEELKQLGAVLEQLSDKAGTK
ncbi:MAG: UPF0182 family protein [Luteitalea sp.]|nr:UPF0182 family protein [Luteitalea sp.]